MDNGTNFTQNENRSLRLKLAGREFIIVGTAHISRQSIADVEEVLRSEKPDIVCVELDKGRYQTLSDNNKWKNIDISRVLKEKKGFLLFANMILASFQRRLGLETGVKPGDEMLVAIKLAAELNIPVALCDREVQITLRRAWASSSFWGKNKMIAALLTSLLINEKISPEEMEKLKEKDLMQSMLEELAQYLPKVKEVLIDERDIYLANKIWQSEGQRIVAVVGAGHVAGICKILKELALKNEPADLTKLEEIPQGGVAKKIMPWIIPILASGLIALGFFLKGTQALQNILAWVIATSAFAGLGTLVALGHPLAVLAAAVSAPITALLPVIGSGMVSGLVQYRVRKPRVADFEAISDDLALFRNFYKNRVLKVFLVFFFTNLLGSLGTLVGISLLGTLLG